MKSLLARFFGWSAPRVSPDYARERAARGAAYLDRVDPGWHRRLDLGALALSDGGSCVLGQLHGSFRNGLGRARLFHPGSAPRASLSPVAYGFHCVHAGREAQRRDYELLDVAWAKEARQRQATDRDERRRHAAAPRPSRSRQRSRDASRTSASAPPA